MGIARPSYQDNFFDAAFVSTAGRNISLTNTLPNGQSLLTSFPSAPPARYHPVSMVGAQRSGVRSVTRLNQPAHVIEVRGNLVYGDIRINDVVLTNIPVFGGDSGGAVFSTNNRQTLGIVVGGNQDVMAFLPANRIFERIRVNGRALVRF